jgi:hypothetical protein
MFGMHEVKLLLDHLQPLYICLNIHLKFQQILQFCDCCIKVIDFQTSFAWRGKQNLVYVFIKLQRVQVFKDLQKQVDMVSVLGDVP